MLLPVNFMCAKPATQQYRGLIDYSNQHGHYSTYRMDSVENKLLQVKGFQKYYCIHQAKVLSNCLELTRNSNCKMHIQVI